MAVHTHHTHTHTIRRWLALGPSSTLGSGRQLTIWAQRRPHGREGARQRRAQTVFATQHGLSQEPSRGLVVKPLVVLDMGGGMLPTVRGDIVGVPAQSRSS